jgi:hypothetical protein
VTGSLPGNDGALQSAKTPGKSGVFHTTSVYRRYARLVTFIDIAEIIALLLQCQYKRINGDSPDGLH